MRARDELDFFRLSVRSVVSTGGEERSCSRTPMGRYGETEELIGSMVWLLSDASRFLTGGLIPIDGDFSSITI